MLESGRDAMLRRAGRQLAAALVATPIVDVADDNGLLGALVSFDLEMLGLVRMQAWAWLGFFVVVGAAFAHLWPKHRAGGRRLFMIAGLVPVAAYWIVGGLRLSVVISVLLLALAFVSWSTAGPDPERSKTPAI